MINKAVLYMLKNSTELTAIIGSKAFPVVMPESTTAPCIVFMTDLQDVEYSKAAPVTDVGSTSVIMFSKDYVESIDIAAAVRTALENNTGDKNGVNVTTSRLNGSQEGYDVDAETFFQKLTFTIKSQK